MEVMYQMEEVVASKSAVRHEKLSTEDFCLVYRNDKKGSDQLFNGHMKVRRKMLQTKVSNVEHENESEKVQFTLLGLIRH